MHVALTREDVGRVGLRFAVIPRRWAVEGTFAWLTAHRRLVRDYERDPAPSEAMIRWAAINTMTRRIARGGPAHQAGSGTASSPFQVDLLDHTLRVVATLGRGDAYRTRDAAIRRAGWNSQAPRDGA